MYSKCVSLEKGIKTEKIEVCTKFESLTSNHPENLCIQYSERLKKMAQPTSAFSARRGTTGTELFAVMTFQRKDYSP